jgi:hypothetical protein
LLAQADQLTEKYETELKTQRQSAQAEIIQAQKDFKSIIENDFATVDNLTNSYVNDITQKVLTRNSELFQLMFDENADENINTKLDSYNLSSQLFYNIWFPYYNREKRKSIKKKRSVLS